MSEQGGRHHADGVQASNGRAPAPPSGQQPGPVAEQRGDEAAYRRPDGLSDTFAPRDPVPVYTPPPPTVAPEERETFGRPAGAGAYAAPPGARLQPRASLPPTVAWPLAEAFAASPDAKDGFAPPGGTRIAPAAKQAESPWWKTDAQRDPWRDPSSPFWLGRGAVFSAGQPAQLDPGVDVEHDEDEDGKAVEPPEKVAAISSGRPRFGLNVILLSVLIAVLAGAIGGYGGYFLAGKTRDALHRSDVSIAQVGGAANRPPQSIAGIAKRVGPAVVSLAVTSADKNTSGVGSGVVIDKNGYVLTNNHVAAVAKDGGTIIATFSNESTARAQIVGLDPISDLAVVKVPDDELTVATLGKSADLAVGDPVIAIGSPLGLEGTVTSGIVSALNRAVHVFGDDGSSDAYLDAIQTDAAINPGNSGGALLDATGAVIGINSAAATGSANGSGGTTQASGIGYAIPIDYAREIALELIKSGTAKHGSLEAQGRTAQAGLQSGAYLEQVVPKGAAAEAGLANGDVIIVADGKPIQGYDQLEVLVQEHKPGDKISVTFFRGSAKKTATVTLGSA